jgi:hypothetical protein
MWRGALKIYLWLESALDANMDQGLKSMYRYMAPSKFLEWLGTLLTLPDEAMPHFRDEVSNQIHGSAWMPLSPLQPPALCLHKKARDAFPSF